MRWKWIVAAVCAFIMILMVTAYGLLSTYDFNSLKPEIHRLIKEATGREVTLGGDINLEFGLTPTLNVNDVNFQNAPWGSRPQMAKIKRLEVQVAIISLIFGEIRLKRLLLVDPDILIETDRSGRSNLEFGSDNKVISEKPHPMGLAKGIKLALVVSELQLTKGKVTYRDGRSGKVCPILLESLTAVVNDRESSVKTDLKGSYRNIPFKVEGSFGSLDELVSENSKPWPLSVTAEALDTALVVGGTIKDIRVLRGMDLGFAVKGNNLATLTETFGTPVPLKGPFSFSGRVSDPALKAYRISGLKVAVAGSILNGTIETNLSGSRPMVKAILTSPTLDIRPILTEGSNSGHVRSDGRDGNVFPESPLPFETLSYFDADLNIQARQVLLPKLTLNQVSVKADLKDGRLLVKPFKALVADGGVEAKLDLQSQGKAGVLATSIRIDHLDLGQMLKMMKGVDVLEGHVDVSIDVWGYGNSFAGLLGGLNGKTVMVMGQGNINNSYLDLLGTDASSIFFDLFNLSKQSQADTPVTCFVSGFSIKDGLAETTALVLETDHVSVIGDGEINLRTERLNLRLNSVPKGGIGTNGLGKITLSLGAMIKAFRVTGTIAHPSVSIDTEQTAVTLGKMIGGTVLLGPIGLLAGLVTGGEVESPCSLAKRAATQGVKMSALAKEEKKGINLFDLPEEGLRELSKGLKKLFGQ